MIVMLYKVACHTFANRQVIPIDVWAISAFLFLLVAVIKEKNNVLVL